MGIFGTILGATIGMFLGGPLGAIAGAALGSMTSPGNRGKYTERVGQRMNRTEHAQMVFYVGAFSMLAKLAQADGEVSDEERAKVEEFMAQDLRLDAQTKESARRIFNSALNSPESFHRIVNQFYQQFRFQPQFFELMVDIMLRISVADRKGLTQQEETLIIDAVHIFRMSDARYQQMKARYVQQTTSAYSLLGCSPQDSDDIIKKAYRKLVNEYHPDKIASKGLPQEFQQIATEKFREIQEAYEAIKKERRF